MVLCSERHAVGRVDSSGPVVGIRAPDAPADAEQGVRLVGAMRKNTAGPVMLERSADKSNAIRKQSGSNSVATITLDRLAVEEKSERLSRINSTAGWKTERLSHHLPPVSRFGRLSPMG